MPSPVSPKLMWIIGGPLIALFFFGGLGFWYFLPSIGIGQIWVAVSVFLLLLYGGISRRVAKGNAEEARLLKTGLRGKATILSIQSTGVAINRRPQMRLQLKVELPGKAPYEVVHKLLLPMVTHGAIDAGVLTVAVDREDPKKLAVVWDAPPRSQPAINAGSNSMEERLKQLAQLFDKKLISQNDYEQKKRELLDRL